MNSAIILFAAVTLNGPIGERLNLMIENHVVKTDIDYLTAPFFEKTERRWRWQSEFWGKYMHAAVPFQEYSRSEKLAAKIDRGIERMLASQEECGYIGNYPDDLRMGEGWDVWGCKYTMMGLLHYYDGALKRGDKSAADRTLASCRRLCDYIIGEIGPNGKRKRELWQTGNWSGYASSSILEPVVWLYKRTKEKKYLDFAAYIVRGIEKPESGPRLIDLALKGVAVADRNGYGNDPETHGGYVMKHNRWKAYEMMSCYQGLLEYWEVTGEQRCLDAARMTGENIIATEINLAGGCASSEAWFHGRDKQHLPYVHLQETCVTTTWMRFCEKLLAITRDPKWADEIERSFYNIYLAAMKPDGSTFAAYVPLSGVKYYGHDHCDMHQNCCNANGPRGALCFLREFFKADGNAAVLNFYASALMEDRLADGRRVSFEMYTVYPRQGTARIVSHTAGVGKVPLKLRIPSWSANTIVKLNGSELKGVKGGSYYTIEREWKLGDTVEIKFDLSVKAHFTDFGKAAAKPGPFAGKGSKATLRPHHVAFTRGPILLARDNRFNDGDLAEPYRESIAWDQSALKDFKPVVTPSDDIWMTFTATLPIGVHTENPEGSLRSTVYFCDYASAGNRWSRQNYYRTWFPIEYGPTE